MSKAAHEYAARVVWEGNLGAGTASYASYSRTVMLSTRGEAFMTSLELGRR
jgi:hypothetical protein